jgi:hypothetical protein
MSTWFLACCYLSVFLLCFGIPVNVFQPESFNQQRLSEPQRVLLLHSDFSDAVEVALKQTGQFAEVSRFRADQGIPTLQLLKAYDAVLVWSVMHFYDAISLGDVLADYWDEGGRVVLAQFSMTNSSQFETSRSTTRLQGRFGTPEKGYLLLTPLDRDPACERAVLYLSAAARQDSLLSGVGEVGGTGCLDDFVVINGAEVVASWSNGYPLLVRRTRGGRCIVALNAVPTALIAAGEVGQLECLSIGDFAFERARDFVCWGYGYESYDLVDGCTRVQGLARGGLKPCRP